MDEFAAADLYLYVLFMASPFTFARLPIFYIIYFGPSIIRREDFDKISELEALVDRAK